MDLQSLGDKPVTSRNACPPDNFRAYSPQISDISRCQPGTSCWRHTPPVSRCLLANIQIYGPTPGTAVVEAGLPCAFVDPPRSTLFVLGATGEQGRVSTNFGGRCPERSAPHVTVRAGHCEAKDQELIW